MSDMSFIMDFTNYISVRDKIQPQNMVGGLINYSEKCPVWSVISMLYDMSYNMDIEYTDNRTL